MIHGYVSYIKNIEEQEDKKGELSEKPRTEDGEHYTSNATRIKDSTPTPKHIDVKISAKIFLNISDFVSTKYKNFYFFLSLTFNNFFLQFGCEF